MPLSELRDQIDAVDQQLIDLLAERLRLVGKVGEVKTEHGLPIYVPEREAAMLAKRRDEAEEKGVPANLIEDILRRTMRESYASENDTGFKTVNPQMKRIVIIGGNGLLGKRFVEMFELSGYQVDIFLLSSSSLIFLMIVFSPILPVSRTAHCRLCLMFIKVLLSDCILCSALISAVLLSK